MFKTPVTGGNVSFYNESPQAAVDPTPVVGMLGVIEDPRHITTQWFKTSGDCILLIGSCTNELGGSEYLPINRRGHDTPTEAIALESCNAAGINYVPLNACQIRLVDS